MGKPEYQDLEAGGSLLFPGIDSTDNLLRWGFIRKVYGIVACQLALTALVATVVVLNSGLRNFLAGSMAVQLGLMLLTLLGLVPLYIYRHNHPKNLIFLGLWTAAMSLSLGVAVSFYQTAIVLEAVVLTAAILIALTAYTFYATAKGVEFGFMGPMLFAGLWALIAWSFIQLFFSPGPIARTVFSLLGALLFSAYIVFDTHMLISRNGIDEYVWTSVSLYLDVVNLFLYILRLLGQAQNNR